MDINESRVFTDFLLRNSDFDVERKRLVLNRKLDLFGLSIYIFLQTLLMYLIIGFSTQTVSRPCSASSSCGPSTDWIPSLTNVPRPRHGSRQMSVSGFVTVRPVSSCAWRGEVKALQHSSHGDDTISVGHQASWNNSEKLGRPEYTLRSLTFPQYLRTAIKSELNTIYAMNSRCDYQYSQTMRQHLLSVLTL